MQTHYSWLVGLIPPKQKTKTTRTLCGVRVATDRIDNIAPTCPDCIEESKRRKRGEVSDFSKV